MSTFEPPFNALPSGWIFKEKWMSDTGELLRFPWPVEQRQVTVYGKTFNQPRLVAWFGKSYSYSGCDLQARPLPNSLVAVAWGIERTLNMQRPFNSVLVNLYRDGQDSVGWHADNEAEIDQTMPIASLSVGAERSFKIRPVGFMGSIASVVLGDGDLLVMPPGAQATHQHHVPKTKRPVGPRLNFTFRCIKA